MKHDHLVEKVRDLAQLTSTQDAVSIIRSTLVTLAERLSNREAGRLAAQLPEEIGAYLTIPPGQGGESFSLEEFFERVARREEKEVKDVVHGVRAATEMVTEAVPPRELNDLLCQLPSDFQQLFDAGPRNASTS